MKINFLGDSITYGSGSSARGKDYVSLVGKILGADVNNYGVGGTRFAVLNNPKKDSPYEEDFNTRARKMGDADIVFVFGGTNDYGHGTTVLGDKKSRNVYEFCGAINLLIDFLDERYGKEKAIFILPLPRYGGGNRYGEFEENSYRPTFYDYVKAEREVLEERGQTYLDFSEFFPEPETDKGDALTVDGLHPNDRGHALLAEKICEYLKKRSQRRKSF